MGTEVYVNDGGELIKVAKRYSAGVKGLVDLDVFVSKEAYGRYLPTAAYHEDGTPMRTTVFGFLNQMVVRRINWKENGTPELFEDVAEQPAPVKTVGTVQLAPTWAAVMPILLAVLQDGSAEGKKMAAEELTRLATEMDKLNQGAR